MASVWSVWHRLLALFLVTVRGVRRNLRRLAMRILDERTYQFRLSSLLLAVLLIAIPLAWYGCRLRTLHKERIILEGKWRALGLDGNPIVVKGQPFIVELTPDNYTVDPFHDPKWLDFLSPSGTSHAIYRWEGRRLRVAQASPGAKRPTTFSYENIDLVLKPGAQVTTESKTIHLLESEAKP